MAYHISDDDIVIGISFSALFNTSKENEIFEKLAFEEYSKYQSENETEILEPGLGFSFIKGLLRLNGIIPDKKVLAIEFEVVNNGEEQLYFGSEKLSIAASDGTQYSEYFGMDDAFMNENINAGNKINGKVYFDVAEDTKYTLTYTPTFTFEDL